MSKSNDLKEFLLQIRSGNSGLWVVSHEHEEFARQLQGLVAGGDSLQVAVWDLADGLLHLNSRKLNHKVKDPVVAVRGWRSPANRPEQGEPFHRQEMLPRQGEEDDRRYVLVLCNYHEFLSSPAVKQNLLTAIVEGKSEGLHYVVLSPKTEVPVELQSAITQLDHRPPTFPEIRAIADDLAEGFFADAELETVRGLTRRQVEQELSTGLTGFSEHQSRQQLLDELWEAKAKCLRQRPSLKLLRSKRGFDSLGGLAGIKKFLVGILDPDDDLPAKGVLLLGPPGTGKSTLAAALGHEVGRPVVKFSPGDCMGKHVGDSEGELRATLAAVESMGRVVLMVDEVEKALAGSDSDGDSGVARRMLGTLLSWMSDRTELNKDVFIVATSNDVSRLPPELTRAGRFNRTFFLDLPSEEEREQIWRQYTAKYSIPWEQYLAVKDAGFTGAEIEECCYSARKLKLSLHEASQEIVPVSKSCSEQIEALRERSSERYVCARTGRVYRYNQQSPSVVTPVNPSRRKIEGGQSTRA